MGLLERPVRPRWTADVRQFFAALGPAVIGSAGVQIAIFADTIIASMLPTGGLSSIYYADRIYQLPIGVIGIAAGTVLLPEMTRLIAGGRTEAALGGAKPDDGADAGAVRAVLRRLHPHSRSRSCAACSCMAASTPEAAHASAAVLAAYGFGMLPVVLIRSAVASFQARGDTRTPMIASLCGVAFNVGLKLVLFKPLGAAGLATATAVGAWVNLALLTGLALRTGTMRFDATLAKVAVAVDIAATVLAGIAIGLDGPLGPALCRTAVRPGASPHRAAGNRRDRSIWRC